MFVIHQFNKTSELEYKTSFSFKNFFIQFILINHFSANLFLPCCSKSAKQI